MNPYIFFLDIDGTLAARGEVPEENVLAIKEAQKAGHYVFINTGRSYAHIHKNIRNAAPYDGFVCALGTDIRFQGEQIFSHPLSIETLEKITEIFLQIPETFSVFEGEETLYFVDACMEHWPNLQIEGVKIKSVQDWKAFYPDVRISKFDHGTIDGEPLSDLYDVLTPYVHPTYAEYGQKGFNKASGMRLVAQKLGVPMERCVAIGDSANDKEMLMDAGIAVVMQNGIEDIKKIATFVTGNAWEAGVSQAIRKLIKGA